MGHGHCDHTPQSSLVKGQYRVSLPRTSTGLGRVAFMSSKSGAFCLVLHGHMPYVLRHGSWPHGESWLFEAAIGVYLPLLDVLERLAARNRRFSIALGLTPILMEQLRDPRFVEGFTGYIAARLQRASHDQKDPDLRELAVFWERRYLRLQKIWDGSGKDIVGSFAAHARAGRMEILGSYAAHAYGPLLHSDQTIEQQLRLGLDMAESQLGWRPTGMWLPECAFRPEQHCQDAFSGGAERFRLGIDRIVESEGITHFFVESTLFEGVRSEGVLHGGHFHKVGWEARESQPEWMWGSVMEPHWVSTVGRFSSVAAFARHPSICSQVWSADHGYPGDGRYLEFHKMNGGSGLKYWRVTDRSHGLGAKKLYSPEIARSVCTGHASHWCDLIRQHLVEYRTLSRPATLTACFDAELFGHWWFEGPDFLFDVLDELSLDPDIEVCAPKERLQSAPPDKWVWLPEGSWGAEGDHRVWLNEGTHWMWETMHRCEQRFHSLAGRIERAGGRAEELLPRLKWALSLLLASDWIFVLSTGGAVDYGYKRFCLCWHRFDSLADMAEGILGGSPLSPLQEASLNEIKVHQPLPSVLSQRDIRRAVDS
jgi:1,4-alpha-glucan branching enzyme